MSIAEAKFEKRIETSVTLSYQDEEWGTERIALDGIQNHLPSDSGGSSLGVDFLVDDAWIPFRDRKPINRRRINAVRFSDNGRGFSYDLLGVFHSTKKGQRESVGQFGEGIKMLSAATLRDGIGLEIRSRNWFAVPVVKELDIDGEQVKRVDFNVYNNQPQSDGSMTVFRNPKRDFIDYVMELDRKVLLLRDVYKPLLHTNDGDIVDTSGEVYAKGIFVTDEFRNNLLFGYDLKAETNRDRSMVKQIVLKHHIGRILRELDDSDLIEKILQRAAAGGNYLEFDVFSEGGTYHSGLWKESFTKLFGEDAVLSSGRGEDLIAKILGYDVVDMPKDFRGALFRLGIPNSRTVQKGDDLLLFSGEEVEIDDVKRRVAETSITLSYRDDKWDASRIVLDALANHMPNDSGGSKVKIEYLVNGGWYSRESVKGHDVKAIRFADDGRGFVYELLELLHTTKRGGDVVGQFGEGLKMYCAAFLRYKEYKPEMSLRMRSRDWVAIPFATDVDIDGETCQRLNFKIAEGLSSQKGSTTTIYNPTLEIRKIVDSIQKVVLSFNSDYRPIYETSTASIFDGTSYGEGNEIEKGSVFVKDFFVSSEHSESLLFSYNIRTSDVTPDRDRVGVETVKAAVRESISQCADDKLVEKIITTAVESEKDYFEFQGLSFENEKVAGVYKRVFHRLFGEKAVVYTENPFIFAEAKHRGYTPIKLHHGLRQTLQNAGVMVDTDVVDSNWKEDVVQHSRLTRSEREVLERYKDVNRVLGFDDTGPPIIYANAFMKDGTEVSAAGFYKLDDGTIHIKRSELMSLEDFIETYTHEKKHEETGARDPEDKFRKSFEKPLAAYVLSELEGRSRVVTEYQPADARPKLRAYEKRITELQKEIDRLKDAQPGFLTRMFRYLFFERS